jgi:hypothetical protein
VERLEKLAQGRDLNEVVSELLNLSTLIAGGKLALAVAKSMDTDWLDEPDISARNDVDFGDYLREKWMRIQ